MNKTIEQIRKRPGMYVGGTDSMALNHLLFWVFDDLLDNARAGRGTHVNVEMLPDGGCEIIDDGPGIDGTFTSATSSWEGLPPRGVASPKQVRSYLVLLRALSRRLEIGDRRGSGQVSAIYEHGLEKTTYVSELMRTYGDRLLVRFWPDPDIFDSDAAFIHASIRERLHEMAATHAGYRARFVCDDENSIIHLPNGMKDMMIHHGIGDGFHPGGPFHLVVREPPLQMDLAVQWRPRPSENLLWGNTIRTRSGAHLDGLVNALAETPGLPGYWVAYLSVFLPQPRFTSPVKDRLSNPELESFVYRYAKAGLARALAAMRSHESKAT